MESLHERTEKLIAKLKSTNNPRIRSSNLARFSLFAFRDGQISFYDAYVLNMEQISLKRLSYTQPAWGWYGKISIGDLLDILNAKMLSILFQDERTAKMFEAWGKEAYQMPDREKRSHCIADEYLSFLNAENDPVRLKRLLKIRERKNKPFDNGPYHDEVFPYDYCNYESLLLAGERLEPQPLGEEVERLLVELYVMLDD